MNKKQILVLSAILLLTAAGCNKTQNTAAQYFLDSFVGSVQVSPDKGASWKEGEAGMSIAESDTVRTGADSYCDIVMPDKGILRVTADTTLFVSTLNSTNARLDIENGKLVVNIADKLKPTEQFRVESSTAVVAVRGTEFVMDVADDGSTALSVNEGVVAFRQKLEGVDTNQTVVNEIEDALEVTVTNAQVVEYTAEQHETLRATVREMIRNPPAQTNAPAVVTNNGGQVVAPQAPVINPAEIAVRAHERVRVAPRQVADHERLRAEFNDLSDDQVRTRVRARVELQSHRMRQVAPVRDADRNENSTAPRNEGSTNDALRTQGDENGTQSAQGEHRGQNAVPANRRHDGQQALPAARNPDDSDQGRLRGNEGGREESGRMRGTESQDSSSRNRPETAESSRRR